MNFDSLLPVQHSSSNPFTWSYSLHLSQLASQLQHPYTRAMQLPCPCLVFYIISVHASLNLDSNRLFLKIHSTRIQRHWKWQEWHIVNCKEKKMLKLNDKFSFILNAVTRFNIAQTLDHQSWTHEIDEPFIWNYRGPTTAQQIWSPACIPSIAQVMSPYVPATNSAID